MAKLTVWECDRCTRQVTQPELPERWMVALAYDRPLDSGVTGDTLIAQQHLWCRECWERIATVNEQTAQITAMRFAYNIAYLMVYRCGHPRGGCESHCNPLVQVMDKIRAALCREGVSAPKS